MIKLPRGESCGEVVKFWRNRAYNDSVETSYQELRQKQIVNLCDGKQLGKTSDVVFTYPEGRVLGIVAPGGKGFRWGKSDVYIDVKCVTKIGVDVIFVELKSAPRIERKKGLLSRGKEPYSPPNSCPPPRRDYGEYE